MPIQVAIEKHPDNEKHADKRINLFDFTRKTLALFFEAQGEKAFRANQLFRWIHQQQITDFEQMTDLSQSLRSWLQTHATLTLPTVVREQHAKDGTCKWLLRLHDGNCIETVYIPTTNRGTLCVSSQVGCALNCQFCSTAKQGFNRNLSISEIIGQVTVAVKLLTAKTDPKQRRITNVVMMGMGEPLLNFDAVLASMEIMMDDYAYGLSKRRVTLSTSGVVPALKKLREQSDVALAVSLHAANDRLRNELVPINKKYPLSELLAVCRDYFPPGSGRVITIEYVMLSGVNDCEKDAKDLVKLLQGIPCKINLIPFNPFPNTPYRCSEPETIAQFQRQLRRSGFITVVRTPRGDDIDAACGQLAGQGQIIDRTSRHRRYQEAKEKGRSL